MEGMAWCRGKANVELRDVAVLWLKQKQRLFSSAKGVRNQGYLPQGASAGALGILLQSAGKSQQGEGARQQWNEPVGPAGPVTWMDGEVAK